VARGRRRWSCSGERSRARGGGGPGSRAAVTGASGPPPELTSEELARFVELWGSLEAALRELERPLPEFGGRSSLEVLRRRPWWRTRARTLEAIYVAHVRARAGVYL